MYVSGLKIGLSSDDLKSMPIGRLMWMVKAVSDEQSGGESQKPRETVRDATQSDIKNFLCC